MKYNQSSFSSDSIFWWCPHFVAKSCETDFFLGDDPFSGRCFSLLAGGFLILDPNSEVFESELNHDPLFWFVVKPTKDIFVFLQKNNTGSTPDVDAVLEWIWPNWDLLMVQYPTCYHFFFVSHIILSKISFKIIFQKCVKFLCFENFAHFEDYFYFLALF